MAHKLSTVKRADQIAVVDRGTIVEIGAHIDLIFNKNSHYSRLVRLQRIAISMDPDPAPEIYMPSSAVRISASPFSGFCP